MLKPRALDHVGLKVTDMDRSLRFYCDGLGLKLLRRKDNGPGIASAVLAVGTQEMNLFSNPGFAARLTDDDPPGLDHFCLEVESASIEEVLAALARIGIAVAKPPVKRSEGVSLFVDDPDGCRVELIVKNQASPLRSRAKRGVSKGGSRQGARSHPSRRTPAACSSG